NLGGATGASGAQRAERGGEEGAIVSLRGVGDPLLPKRVEAKVRHRPQRCRRGRKRANTFRREVRCVDGTACAVARWPYLRGERAQVKARSHAVARLFSPRTSSPATSTSRPAARIASTSASGAFESVISVCT